MATVAIVPSDIASKRMMAERLGRQLAAAGHRVVLVLAPGDDAADGIESTRGGLRVPTDEQPRNPLGHWRANRRAAAVVDPGELTTALDEIAADLVIADIEEYESLLALLALASGPPTAVLCTFFDIWPITGIGPNDPGPPAGPLDRWRAHAAWWSTWTRMRLHDVKRLLAGRGLDRVAVARALAWRLGVRRRVTAREWLHPFAPIDLPMLVCNALELDIPHDPRPGVHHIGSLLDPLDDRVDAELSAVIAAARADDRPVVLSVSGTVRAAEPDPFHRRLADVAGLRPDVQFVVGGVTGDDRDVLAARPNVVTRLWLPQRELLALSDAAIVHSGNATLHECVVAGVPMLVYPYASNDQPRNAARVLRHRIGEVGDRAGDDASTIAERLDRVLQDGAMRSRVEAMTDPLLAYERNGVAVATVERLLAT